MIQNPVLSGFHPDPSIVRRGDDYYIATSTFEWFPGIAVHHSRDLKNWRLLTHILTDEAALDLRRLPSAKGIWAPCLSWCEADGLFYAVYSLMHSMNARFFDVDNFLVSSPEITGPWSVPSYLNSVGFDPSLFHDSDGKKYVVSLEWEFRDGYKKPGVIVLQEWDCGSRSVIGYARRIWTGGTDRGCVEAPHLYKRNGKYYLMCAEGGTGYGHSVTMGRAEAVFGPYEKDPANPILTSTPDFKGRDNDDFLKPDRYNPGSALQKSGHGSLVETRDGQWYLAHLCSRPFVPELRCALGRETALQKMYWTDDNWLRLEGGGNLAKVEVPEPGLREYTVPDFPAREDFDGQWNPHLVSPRTDWKAWAKTASRPGFLRMRGQQSLCSLDRVSLIARRLTSLDAAFACAVEFEPDTFQHSAGLALYYDNMNWVYLRIYTSDSLGGKTLALMRVENGEKTELSETRVRLGAGKRVFMKCRIRGRSTQFYYSLDEGEAGVSGLSCIGGEGWSAIGPVWDTSLFSDEYCKFGEFTGTFAGICCTDTNTHTKYADFDWFEYRDL